MAIVVTPIEIITPNKRYPPVGFCVYCGVYSNKLGKEHIIAHGLAGDSLILPKASCATCASKTRDSETACLRHLWWPFRVRIGAPSSGKQTPETFLLKQMKVTELNPDGFIASYEKLGETPVTPNEFPAVFLAYKFPFPGLIVGRNPDADINIEITSRFSESEFRKFSASDRHGFGVAPMGVTAYCRMLAKIAHSYAAAEIGARAFRPTLCDFIRCKSSLRQAKAYHWIGSDTALPPAEPHLHDIQWSIPTINDVRYVMVSLRLFSFMGSPRYHIIVGELTRPVDQLPFLQQPLYTIQVKTAPPLSQMSPLDQGVRGGGA